MRIIQVTWISFPREQFSIRASLRFLELKRYGQICCFPLELLISLTNERNFSVFNHAWVNEHIDKVHLLTNSGPVQTDNLALIFYLFSRATEKLHKGAVHVHIDILKDFWQRLIHASECAAEQASFYLTGRSLHVWQVCAKLKEGIALHKVLIEDLVTVSLVNVTATFHFKSKSDKLKTYLHQDQRCPSEVRLRHRSRK